MQVPLAISDPDLNIDSIHECTVGVKVAVKVQAMPRAPQRSSPNPRPVSVASA